MAEVSISLPIIIDNPEMNRPSMDMTRNRLEICGPKIGHPTEETPGDEELCQTLYSMAEVSPAPSGIRPK
jgi:hypothetical protein